MNPTTLKKDLIAYANSLGFDRVGITSADPLIQAEDFLRDWLAQGRAGDMDYLVNEPQRRSRPKELLPGAKSVIALAMSYYDGNVRRENDLRVARYAWGRDYHKVIGKRLDSLARYVEALAPGEESRTFVDSGPLLERGFAQRAGLGFVGKNTMVITRGLGSWVFLANMITTLSLPVDGPDLRSCGSCRLCIDACPTEAITAPHVLDPRKCISYLTIEYDGAVASEKREGIGEWLFGCDICQDVCPHNTRIPITPVTEFRKAGGVTDDVLSLEAILDLTDDETYRKQFAGTALMRAGRDSLVRNACTVAANLRRTDLLPRLRQIAARDASGVVKDHAAWAIAQLEKRES